MAGSRRDWLRIALATAAAPAVAVQPRSPARVAWLTLGSPRTHQRLLDAFRLGLRERGWAEGSNLTLDLHWAEGRPERLPDLAARIVASRPDVIVTAPNAVHLAVRASTTTIPIVMLTGSDPVAAGLADSLARPGGNVTGLTGFYESIPHKMLELVAELVPAGARVAVVADRTFHASPMRDGIRERMEASARAKGLKLRYVEGLTNEALLDALKAMASDRPDALLVLPGAQVFALGERLVTLAEALRVPAVYPFEELVDAGGMMSYGPDVPDSYRRAARYVDLILKGAKPGELPIEQPSTLALTINLRTVAARAVRLPPSVRSRASRIVE